MEHSVTGAIRNFGGQAVYVCPAEGPGIARESDALDLIGETYGQDVAWVAIPVGRLSEAFFQLRSGLAGAILQKLTNYRLRVAIVGDIARHLEASQAFADFVTESNRGSHIWFVRDEAELAARLAALP
jgi:hypothetical protein